MKGYIRLCYVDGNVEYIGTKFEYEIGETIRIDNNVPFKCVGVYENDLEKIIFYEFKQARIIYDFDWE